MLETKYMQTVDSSEIFGLRLIPIRVSRVCRIERTVVGVFARGVEMLVEIMFRNAPGGYPNV